MWQKVHEVTNIFEVRGKFVNFVSVNAVTINYLCNYYTRENLSREKVYRFRIWGIDPLRNLRIKVLSHKTFLVEKCD